MTGNDSFGPYPTGGGQPPAGMPGPPQWAPPGGGPWGPGAPPPARRRGSRGLLIAGAVAVVIVAIVVAIVVVTRQSATVSSIRTSEFKTAVPSSLPSNAAPARPFYMLADPADALPTADEVKTATLMELTPNGTPRTTSGPDHPTNPPACSLAASSTTQTMWGGASQLAGQQFTDPHGSSTMAWAGLAFWPTSEAAQASLDRLAAAVAGCGAFTLLGVAPNPDTKWTTSDIRRGDHRIGFTTTLAAEDNGGTPWKCVQDYHVEDNVSVTARMCSPNPSSAAAALSDVVMGKATKH
ncbi:sensor domain-containing protein [Mycobacterium sp. SMC-13]|uniref:sensor domain-containing protein n=1 Tax=Mycobacterium sp. SMC-13 TaxID=3381626 RepID=UPI003875F08A